MRLPRGQLYVAIAQLVAALLTLAGIWIVLPARWWLVDGVGSALALACLASAAGLFGRRAWALKLARAISWATLVIGCGTVSALCFALAHLAGAYGPVGAGGAMLLGVVATLVLPYLVGLPLLQLAWLRRQE
jgi:hypothetical protein